MEQAVSQVGGLSCSNRSSSRPGAILVVNPPGSISSVESVPVPSFLLGGVGQVTTRPSSCLLANAGHGYVRPEGVRHGFRGLLRRYRVPDVGVRSLQRTFTAHYARVKFSDGALSRVLKRSSIGVAVSVCIRDDVGRGRGYVRGLGC